VALEKIVGNFLKHFVNKQRLIIIMLRFVGPKGWLKLSVASGVRAYVQLKSSIPIGGKVEISPKGFTLGVEAALEKIFSICPKLLINAELYGLV